MPVELRAIGRVRDLEIEPAGQPGQVHHRRSSTINCRYTAKSSSVALRTKMVIPAGAGVPMMPGNCPSNSVGDSFGPFFPTVSTQADISTLSAWNRSEERRVG